MNYYEHHIGDYAEATSHLTFIEDAAYSRLIRKYYAREAPLPADVAAVQRLVSARTREEKDAVAAMLQEFFVLNEDGWHQQTCDEVIAAYLAGEPEREVKKANENNRQQRFREERSRLFKIITDAGHHAEWNIKMQDLRDLAARISGQPATAPKTAPATTPVTPPATAPATPATATQTPVPITQTPGLNTSDADASGGTPPAPPSPPPLELVPPAPPKPDKPRNPVREEIWQAGRSVLVSGGMPKDQAGSYLGKLVQDYGQPIVLDAVRIAVAETPAEPRGFLKATCMRLAGERKSPNRQEALEDSNYAAAQAFAQLGEPHATV